MIYVSYGVPKSASTFTYVVIETVMKAAGLALVTLSGAAQGGKSRLNYIDPITWPAIERVATEIGKSSTVIKTHSGPDTRLLEAIERREVFASAVVRDPREIALALLDHAKRSRGLGIKDFAEFETVADTFKALDDQFARLRRWMSRGNVLLLTYNEVCFDTASAVRKIIDQIGLPIVAADVLSNLPDPAQVEQFNRGVRGRHEGEMPAEEQQAFLERYADVYEGFLGIPGKSLRRSQPRDQAMPITQAGADKYRWFHSLNLGNGIITKGQKSTDHLQHQVDTVFRYDVAGKTVLDIGAWDGAFSFAAEQRGASRVLATDHFCWVGAGWGQKSSFDFARTALGSRIESKIIDVPEISRETVGEFDVVLFLGVFYHRLHPFLELTRLAPVVRELFVLDTETALDDEDRPLMTFFPGRELNNDPTNWWAPNIKCVEAMLRHVGFRRIEVSPTWPYDGGINHQRGRFTFHAWK